MNNVLMIKWRLKGIAPTQKEQVNHIYIFHYTNL